MKKQNKQKLHPIISYLFLIFGVIFLSLILNVFGLQSSYYKINSITLSKVPQTEVITSMINTQGLKYVFTNTVSNFANFTILSNLIIILIGMSIMDKSGFLKTIITMTTKKLSKKFVSFIFIFLCIISSIIGNISYLIFIPLGAYLYYYGKRNPAIGIISSFAALSIGSSLNFLFTSNDSELLNYTNLAANTINKGYTISPSAFWIIMLVAVILVTYVITYITEGILAKNISKYEFEEEVVEDDLMTSEKHKGIVSAFTAAGLYLLFFIYSIIPGLPLSGMLLDNSQSLYIDKLFSVNSNFNNGFIFIITMLFIILGLFYGIGAKTIKNQKDFGDCLGHSLDGIGNMLVMIFFASMLISIFKQTNIGNVIVALFCNLIETLKFNGIPLIILLFVSIFICSIFVPSSTLKWYMLAPTVVPVAMNSGLSPEFTQVIYSFASTSSLCITPLLAYFIVYLAFLEKYNQEDEKIGLKVSIKYQLPYMVSISILLIIIIIIWYIIGLPLGINSIPTI